jgi:hypothetical protein
VSRHPERTRPRPQWSTTAIVAIATALSLAACSNPLPAETPARSSAPTVSPSASPLGSASPTPTEPGEPALLPEGTAEDNLPLFSAVTAAVWASPDQVSGRAYVDALVAAGFDKAAMQLTPDQSTVGNPAEAIQFSVHWDDACLVGQVGPATGAPVTVVVPALADGTCLIGSTRPIDW